jgi:hypothetical protein
MLTTTMTRIATRTAAIASLALACHSAGATPVTWDAAADFYSTKAAGTNSVWSYGSTDKTLTGTFTKFDVEPSSSQDVAYKVWTFTGLKPSLGKAVKTGAGGITWHVPIGTINMHPGAQGEYSVLRFLAQNNGDYTIDTDFWANDSTTSDVHVLADGVEKYSTAITNSKTLANPASWTGTVTLSAGDFIDFLVGRGGLPSSTWNNDSTGISALISYTAPVVTAPSNFP